jgi:predicted TIM-barrel fold metal-dependent hydrolase
MNDGFLVRGDARHEVGARLAFVDAHQHFQDLAHNPYPWLSERDWPPALEGDLEQIRRDYLPPDYRRDVAAAEVRKSVHVENGWDRRDPVAETRWLEALIGRTGEPTAIVAYADLADARVDETLEAHWAASAAVRGIRQILNWHPDPSLRSVPSPDLMESTAWRNGFALLESCHLSFDLQIYWPQMGQALALAMAFPDTTIILDHFGMPIDRTREGVCAWASALRRLAQAPNVAVKLSGLGLGHPAWTALDTVPLLTRTIEIFGPERVMVGTNLPVDRLFADGSTIVQALGAAVAPLAKAEAYAVLCGTAERLYRI